MPSKNQFRKIFSAAYYLIGNKSDQLIIKKIPYVPPTI